MRDRYTINKDNQQVYLVNLRNLLSISDVDIALLDFDDQLLDVSESMDERVKTLVIEQLIPRFEVSNDSEKDEMVMGSERYFYVSYPVVDQEGQKVFRVVLLSKEKAYEDDRWMIAKYIIETLLETTNEIVYFKDAFLRYIFYNRAWYNFASHQFRGGIGKRYVDFYKSRNFFPVDYEVEVIRHGREVEYEKCVFEANNSHDFHSLLKPILNKKGICIAVCCIISDMKVKREDENLLPINGKRIQEALDEINIFYLEASNYTKYALLLSKNLLRFLGYSDDDLIEDIFHLKPYMHPEDFESWYKHLQEYIQGTRKQVDFKVRMLKKDGSYNWMHYFLKTTRKDSYGNMSFQAGALIDIHELVLAKESAEIAEKAKNEFLSNMSHEIRTPMNAILGFAELMENTELTVKQKLYLEKSVQATQGLLGLIDDILDYSRIESGDLEVHKAAFNLKKVLNNIYNIMTLKAMEKKIHFNMELQMGMPEKFIGDNLRLNQVLINLCNNAVKFTDEGSVGLSVTYNEGCLGFRVVDTGIGMTEEELSRVFSSFTQADASITRKYGGSGLGLAISKRLIQLMGGELTARSIFGEGSEFEFKLPIEIAKTQAIEEVDRVEILRNIKAYSRNRILLVEDLPMNQIIITENLLPLGFKVDVAVNGEEAVELVGSKKEYDLVLMDLQMPVMDGYEASKIIREMYTEEELPIIALTADAMVDTKEKIISFGMQEHLTKPLSIINLYQTMMDYLDRKEIENSVTIEKSKMEALEDLQDVLSMDKAIDRWGGSRELYARLLKATVDEYDQGIDVQSFNDREALIRYFHNLKAVCGNIGADQIGILSGTLETALMETDVEILTMIKSIEYKSLVEQFDLLLRRLNVFFEN